MDSLIILLILADFKPNKITSYLLGISICQSQY